VGGMAFYLAMRFWLSKEFESFDLNNFLHNSKWFDIKLLTDATRADHDHEKPMANDTYGKAIKEILGKLGIASNHWVHLGRTLGPKILEVLELEAEIIRQLGNWDPKTQETSYSTKLPMKVIRAACGFFLAMGMHFNLRTTVEGLVLDRLLKKTPFAWAYDAVAFFEGRFEEEVVDGHYTAFQFCKFIADLNKVFLQDAAAMLVKFPERADCAMYRMPVFLDPDWPVSIFCVFLIHTTIPTNTFILTATVIGFLGADEADTCRGREST
jgi:hypothetical protein